MLGLPDQLLSEPGGHEQLMSFSADLTDPHWNGFQELNVNDETIVFGLNSYSRGSTPGMTMDIGQTFLNDAENGEFYVVWQPGEIIRDFQIDVDLAALRKSIHVPAQRRDQTGDFEKGRVKKMGEGTYLAGGLLYQLGIL